MVWHNCYVSKLAGDSRALENSTGDDKKLLGLVWHNLTSNRALENTTGDYKK